MNPDELIRELFKSGISFYFSARDGIEKITKKLQS
jgi:hypothetical protein